MEIKPLTQRQLLTMKRANIEVKVKKFWEATKNVDLVTEYIVALIVRNALVVSGFISIFVCSFNHVFLSPILPEKSAPAHPNF